VQSGKGRLPPDIEMFDARRVTNIIGSIIPMMRIVDAKA
jgi:hypothetical protein